MVLLFEIESAGGEESESFWSRTAYLQPFTTMAVISVGCLETQDRPRIIWVNLPRCSQKQPD